MNVSLCSRLELLPRTGHWYRAIRLGYWETRLGSSHSTTVASRFSPASETSPGFRIVYLAETHQVALHEVQALLGNPATPISNPDGSWVLLCLNVILHQIVDLTNPAEQAKIQTSYAELTGNWTNDPGLAPTQELGRALFDQAGVEGFIYYSKYADAKCLAVFPDKLSRRSRISFVNEMMKPPGIEFLT